MCAPWGQEAFVSAARCPCKGLLSTSATCIIDSTLIKFYPGKPYRQIPDQLCCLSQPASGFRLLSKAAFEKSSRVFCAWLSFHPPPHPPACWDVPVPSLRQPSSLPFQGLHPNPQPLTFSMFIRSFSLPGNVPPHTLRSCPIPPRADATCFSVCHASQDNLSPRLGALTSVSEGRAGRCGDTQARGESLWDFYPIVLSLCSPWCLLPTPRAEASCAQRKADSSPARQQAKLLSQQKHRGQGETTRI